MQTRSFFGIVSTSLTVLILSSTVVAGSPDNISPGCSGVSKAYQGADVMFYSYEYNSKLSQQHDFFSELYANKYLDTIYSYLGKLDLMHSPKSKDEPETGIIYGHELTFTNFTAVITGYFYPSESGYHKFEYARTVGGASLRIGANAETCTGFVQKDLTTKFAMKIIDPAHGIHKTEHYSTYLEKDIAYPVEFIVHNWVDDVFFMPSIIPPSGRIRAFEGRMLYSVRMANGEMVDTARG